MIVLCSWYVLGLLEKEGLSTSRWAQCTTSLAVQGSFGDLSEGKFERRRLRSTSIFDSVLSTKSSLFNEIFH